MIEIAVAVIEQDGLFLILQRNHKADFGGLWEFPGGKVEQGETPEHTLYREMEEEIGIQVVSSRLFDQFNYQYPHKTLRFHVFLVDTYNGTAYCKENQMAIKWVAAEQLTQYPYPAANKCIIEKVEQSFARAK